MSFYNGVPITVVGRMQTIAMGTESTSRRRAEEDARLARSNAPDRSGCRGRSERPKGAR